MGPSCQAYTDGSGCASFSCPRGKCTEVGCNNFVFGMNLYCAQCRDLYGLAEKVDPVELTYICNTCENEFKKYSDTGVAGACENCTQQCIDCQNIFFEEDQNDKCPTCRSKDYAISSLSDVICPYCKELVPSNALDKYDMCEDCVNRGTVPHKPRTCAYARCSEQAEYMSQFCTNHQVECVVEGCNSYVESDEMFCAFHNNQANHPP